MRIKVTNRERATILAALQRWHSYPAAREADLIATNGGKYRPLDNVEIERLCKRITRIERERDSMPGLRQSENGARTSAPQIEPKTNRLSTTGENHHGS
jgi:hypothetical protein